MKLADKLSRLHRAVPEMFQLRGSRSIPATLSLTAEQRDELLRRAVAREHVELDADIVAFEQLPGVRNRNSIRFAPDALAPMARTGVGTAYLHDHRQGDVESRLGTITASSGVVEGRAFRIRQTASVREPSAVERFARGLATTFSIGWNATGDVLCSLCGTPVLDACAHLPGEEVTAGKTAAVVEWVFTSAELVETSEVSVPAVRDGTGVVGIRAALSSAFGLSRRSRPDPGQLQRSHSPEVLGALEIDRRDQERARVEGERPRYSNPYPQQKERTMTHDLSTAHGRRAHVLEQLHAEMPEARAHIKSTRMLENVCSMFEGRAENLATAKPAVTKFLAALAKGGAL